MGGGYGKECGRERGRSGRRLGRGPAWEGGVLSLLRRSLVPSAQRPVLDGDAATGMWSRAQHGAPRDTDVKWRASGITHGPAQGDLRLGDTRV